MDDLAASLNDQSVGFRDGIEVAAVDGFTGFKSASAEQLPRYLLRCPDWSRDRGGCPSGPGMVVVPNH